MCSRVSGECLSHTPCIYYNYTCSHVGCLQVVSTSQHYYVHALVALTPNVNACDNSDDNVPVISLSCQWKPPQKRKHYWYLRLTLISLNMAKPVNIVCSCWKTMILDLRNLESQV